MSTKAQFIAAWVTQQQRAFNQSTRGIMTSEQRGDLEREAEAMFDAEIQRAKAEAGDECYAAGYDHVRAVNPYREGGL